MAQPALSVRWRRFWRLFRLEQPPIVQALVLAVAVLLVSDVLALGATTTSSEHTAATVRSAKGTRGGSAGGSDAGPSTTTGPAAGGPGATGSGGGAAPGGGPGGTTPGHLANLGHGVTSNSIRVVFPYANVGAVAQAIGLYGSSEDPVFSIQSAVRAINDAGGIAGRKIDPEIVEFNPLDDASMRADCLHWTQDEHVFAVVDAGAWHDDHQLCIAQENHTPLISTWVTVSDWTTRAKPNLWWAMPNADTVVDNLAAWAASQHYLSSGAPFGIVAADREGDTLALGDLNHSLKNLGLKAADTGSMRFDLQSSAQAQAQARDIVTRFNLEGIHTVIPLLPYTDLLYLIEAAKEQNYVPRWLLSDYEEGSTVAIGLIDPSSSGPYAKELDNTINPTFVDLGNCDCPKPLPIGYDAFGAACNANFNKYYGPQWKAQNSSWQGYIETTGTAMTWCTVTNLFAAAARSVPPNSLTQAAFDQAMAGLTHFPGQLSPDLSYSPVRFAGPHQARIVQEHVNGDHACPKKVDGGDQGDCWLIKRDFQEAEHT